MKKAILINLMISFVSCKPDIETKNEVIVNNYTSNISSNIDSLKNLSIKAGMSGDLNKFKELCEEVEYKDSTDADNLSRLASINLIEGDYEKGIAYVNRSVLNDKNNKLIHNIPLKGCLFYELKKGDSANFYFNIMIKEQYSVLFLNDIVSSFYLFKNENKGVEYINLTYKYFPKNEIAALNKALISQNGNNYDEPIRILNSIKSSSRNPRVFDNLATCYLNKGEYTKGLKEINNGIKLNSLGDPSLYTTRGRLKEKMNDLIGAEQDYKIAMSKGDTVAVRFYTNMVKKNESRGKP